MDRLRVAAIVVTAVVAAGCAVSTPPPNQPAPSDPADPGEDEDPAGGLSGNLAGTEFSVDQDEFRIGAIEGADLPSDVDGECDFTASVVILPEDDGGYRLRDLESKGFEFNGMRMDNKRIDDNDVFVICQGELQFSLR